MKKGNHLRKWAFDCGHINVEEKEYRLQSNPVISPYTVPNTVLARGEVGGITGDTVWTFI